MDSQKKKYFFFPKPNLNHLFLLLFLILSFLKSNIHSYFPKNQKNYQVFFDLYIYNFGDILSIIPYLIVRKRLKSGKRMDYEQKLVKGSQDGINYIYEEKIDETYFYNSSFKKLLIFTIVDFIAQISYVIFVIIITEKNIEANLTTMNSPIIINIIVIFVLSHFILHTKIFRHHYFSLLINIICLIVLISFDISEIINNSNNLGLQLINIFISILGITLYSIEDVLAKVLFLSHYFSPYYILLKKGKIHFFYLLIFNIPFFFIKLTNEKGEKTLIYSMMARIFDKKINILLVFILSIISFFFNFTIMKIIDVFSPNHFAITGFTENLGLIINRIILNGADSEKYLVVKIIIFILLIFASLIQNEFIVINICGLSKDTKLFLNHEAENEFSTILKDDTFDIDEENHDNNGRESEMSSCGLRDSF